MDNSKKQELIYFPKSRLGLHSDIPGAKKWAVALDRTMLTYFEVDSHCRFESHTHESEQITLVLEGVLYFEHEGKVIEVKSGEVIAIPSNAPHAVFTKDKAAKAVDAWSPVMAKYRRASS
jgi:quercetin dioxygenase-like cupin family protein